MIIALSPGAEAERPAPRPVEALFALTGWKDEGAELELAICNAECRRRCVAKESDRAAAKQLHRPALLTSWDTDVEAMKTARCFDTPDCQLAALDPARV